MTRKRGKSRKTKDNYQDSDSSVDVEVCEEVTGERRKEDGDVGEVESGPSRSGDEMEQNDTGVECGGLERGGGAQEKERNAGVACRDESERQEERDPEEVSREEGMETKEDGEWMIMTGKGKRKRIQVVRNEEEEEEEEEQEGSPAGDSVRTVIDKTGEGDHMEKDDTKIAEQSNIKLAEQLDNKKEDLPDTKIAELPDSKTGDTKAEEVEADRKEDAQKEIGEEPDISGGSDKKTGTEPGQTEDHQTETCGCHVDKEWTSSNKALMFLSSGLLLFLLLNLIFNAGSVFFSNIGNQLREIEARTSQETHLLFQSIYQEIQDLKQALLENGILFKATNTND